jgi:hypothetical protein
MARNLTTGLQRGLRRSIAGGLGANDLFSIAPLDLRFAQQKTLDPRVTFTRQSRATYVDSEGVIRTATTNLLLRSEEFDNESWVKGASTTVTANYAVAPNGTTAADRVEMPNTIGTVVSQSATVVSGLTYTFSVYARATATTSAFVIQLGTNTASYVLTAQWQRYSLSFTATGSSLAAAFDNGNNAVDFLVWGAQLEQSSTVGEYIPTTSTINSAPRFDHDPTTGESLGLLVEEARTNLRTFSEDFANAAYSVSTRLTVTADAIVAPNGTTTADKLVATLNNDQKFVETTASVISSFSYAFGMFAKKGEYEVLQISVANTNFSGTLAYANFNLNTGTIVSSVDCTPSIQAIGDGWFRCSVIMAAATGTGANAFRFSPYASGNPGRLASYTGDGTSGVYLWGAQLEVGSFPTSYIPTTTAAATRAADVASISGSNFSSWYRQDSGSWYCSATSLVFDSNERGLFGIDTGSFARGYHAATSSPTRIRTRRRDATNTIATDATLSAGTSARVALVATSTEQATTYNGGAVITNATALTLDPITDLRIGYQNITGSPANLYLCGCLSRLTYWPQRLPNDTLQTITV